MSLRRQWEGVANLIYFPLEYYPGPRGFLSSRREKREERREKREERREKREREEREERREKREVARENLW